jgi:hypothetical protein
MSNLIELHRNSRYSLLSLNAVTRGTLRIQIQNLIRYQLVVFRRL